MSKDINDLSVHIRRNGAMAVYTIINGYFVEEVYFGYTTTEARELFYKKHFTAKEF